MARESKDFIDLKQRIADEIHTGRCRLEELTGKIDTMQTVLAKLLTEQAAIQFGIDKDMKMLGAAKPESRTKKEDKDKDVT